jgi:hypothetical protein
MWQAHDTRDETLMDPKPHVLVHSRATLAVDQPEIESRLWGAREYVDTCDTENVHQTLSTGDFHGDMIRISFENQLIYNNQYKQYLRHKDKHSHKEYTFNA